VIASQTGIVSVLDMPLDVEEDLTYSIIGAFFEVYNTLGFGYLEHVYIYAKVR
jgi:PD-(D/E)XK nuclease superfamily